MRCPGVRDCTVVAGRANGKIVTGVPAARSGGRPRCRPHRRGQGSTRRTGRGDAAAHRGGARRRDRGRAHGQGAQVPDAPASPRQRGHAMSVAGTGPPVGLPRRAHGFARNAVVTGIGLVTPVGASPGDMLDALCTGRSGLCEPPEGHPVAGVLEVARASGHSSTRHRSCPAERHAPSTATSSWPWWRPAAHWPTRAWWSAGTSTPTGSASSSPARAAWPPSTRGPPLHPRTARPHRGQPVPAPRHAASMGAARIAIKYGIRGYSSSSRRVRGRRRIHRRGHAPHPRRRRRRRHLRIQRSALTPPSRTRSATPGPWPTTGQTPPPPAAPSTDAATASC